MECYCKLRDLILKLWKLKTKKRKLALQQAVQ